MKKQIQHAFNRSCATYSETSFLQTEVGAILVHALKKAVDDEFGHPHPCPLSQTDQIRLIDLGCGEGSVTKMFLEGFKTCSITCIDISENMLALAEKNIRVMCKKGACKEAIFLKIDIEDVADILERGKYDIAFSNSSIHWVIDIERAIRAISHILKDKGVFASSIFTKNSLKELDTAFNEVTGKHITANRFWSFDRIKACLLKYFTPIVCERLILMRRYENVFSLLKTLKKTGVNAGSPIVKRPLLMRDIKRMDDIMQDKYLGAMASYEVMVFVGLKR